MARGRAARLPALVGAMLGCALSACDDPAPGAPGDVTQDEAAALRDAEAMLDSRDPEPAPEASPSEGAEDGNN